jgi:SAM-dependent methyltransferase
MSEYVLPHQLRGERNRLDLMSALLDPVERGHFDQLGIGRGWQCLELGCGNGSISGTLVEYVAPTGHVVASDIDLRYMKDLQTPCLEVRRIDLLNDPIEQGAYDLVVARALLHHLTPARKGLARMVEALKPGGVLLSIEPDMLPCTVTEPDGIREFWSGWLRWSTEAGYRLFYWPQNFSLAGFSWPGKCFGRRTHRAF